MNYKFRELKVYASIEWLADNKKKYRQVFDQYETTYIYAELSFYNKKFDEDDWEINVELKCYSLKKGRKEICSLPFKKKVSKYDSVVYIREGWGNKNKGAFWKKGTYYWEAWIEGEKVATKYFYIEDGGKDSINGKNNYFDILSLNLYEGPYDDVIEDQRTYHEKFSSENSRYIYVEITLKNLFPAKSWYCESFTKFYNNARELKGQVIRLQRIEKNDEIIKITAGWGSNVKGSWRPDRYTVEIVFMDKLIAVIPFDIYDESSTNEVSYQEMDYESWIIENLNKPKSNDDDLRIKLPKIGLEFKKALKQYLLVFKDYVKNTKTQNIQFDVDVMNEDLVVSVNSSDDSNILKNYLFEYLELIKHNLLPKPNIEEKRPPKIAPIQFSDNIKTLIGQDRLDEVIEEINKYSKANLPIRKFNQAIILKNEWYTLKNDMVIDHFSYDEIRVRKQKILNRVIDFVDQNTTKP